MVTSILGCAGWWHLQATDGHVYSGCHGNGIPCKDEDGAQRLGSKELHVSSYFTLTYLLLLFFLALKCSMLHRVIELICNVVKDFCPYLSHNWTM